MRFGKAIPRTHFLADVAAECPTFHSAFELIGYRLAQFNGEVGDTFGGVEEITFLADSAGRAGVDAAAAGAAVVADGVVVQQRQVADDLGQEKKRTAFRMNAQGMAAVPADAGECTASPNRLPYP